MNATEKAEDLILKYSILNDGHNHLVKQCALISVDEIINDNPNIYDSDRLNHEYWKEVKRQINLLY